MQISLFQKIIEYVRAGYAAFYLKTAESERANGLIEKLSEELKMTVLEYNLACGLILSINSRKKIMKVKWKILSKIFMMKIWKIVLSLFVMRNYP